jgi:hypothetical protein
VALGLNLRRYKTTRRDLYDKFYSKARTRGFEGALFTIKKRRNYRRRH